MSGGPTEANQWWKLPKGEAFATVMTYVLGVERRQSKIFEKFIRLEYLYDPGSIRADAVSDGALRMGRHTENVIASNVDTVTAAVAAVDVRARFMTDDADWSMQRTARHLEWYAEALSTLLDVDEKCRRGFKLGALKGTGLNYVDIDGQGNIFVESVPVDEIVVDEAEMNGGAPRQIHRRKSVDRDVLKAQYPRFAEQINSASTGSNRGWRLWSGFRPYADNEIVIVYSWRLPYGTKGKKGYIPGRKLISIENCSIVDEAWDEDFFPFSVFRWSNSVYGWYGISGAERILGHQLALNRRNWQIERQLDQGAFPTTYVSMADANLAVKTVNKLGTIAVYKGEIPKTVLQQAVSAETYKSRDDLKAGAFEEFGVSRMAASSAKPAGLDSGIALREYRDQTTQRFALQEKGFEQFKLDTIWLVLWCCKKLGKDAPTVMRQTKFGSKRIKWQDVDMGDVRVQISAASTMSRTPAGRMQTVLEWAQAGVISQDEARRLMQHPDLERAMSIYTAALENIEYVLEEIEDGATMMPEPFQNLEMLVWRGQMEYLKIQMDGAPEEILESLRQYIVQGAWMLAQKNQPANVNADPNAMAAEAPDMTAAGGQPQMPPGGAMPNLPGGPPVNAPAVSALSPQAMQLMAGTG